MDIQINWTRLGNISDSFWYNTNDNPENTGPMLYCGLLHITEENREMILKNSRLNAEYRRLKEKIRPHMITPNTSFVLKTYMEEYERRWYYFRTAFEKIQTAYVLLYIGIVGANRYVGERLFLSEDPLITFPVFYLQIPQTDIILFRGRVYNNKPDRVQIAEKAMIFYHKPLLNLDFMNVYPDFGMEEELIIRNNCEGMLQYYLADSIKLPSDEPEATQLD